MAKRPDVNHARIHGATRRAVDSWLVESGRVAGPDEIDLTRTLESYGLGLPQIDELSNHVIGVVKDETRIDLQLTPDQLRKFGRGTLGHYIERSTIQLMEALPGKPSTPSSGPIDDD